MIRSGRRECVHHGSVVLLAPSGDVLCAIGEVTAPMYPRSSNKPIQALAMLRAGLDLADDADLALVCASHNGEDEHVKRMFAILAGHGLSESDLRCPPTLPLHELTAHAKLAAGQSERAAFMNCSGKHAGLLATCVARGWPTDGYLDPSHPLQRVIADTFAELTGERLTEPGVDGCGTPLYAVSLAGLARCYAKLVTAVPGTQERRVADAMRANPFLVGGADREDTALMTAVPGLLTKGGAEGVHAIALPDGRAAALKIDDGGSRARKPVLVGVLRLFGADPAALADLAEEPVYGGGQVVGTTRLIDGALNLC